MLQFMGSQRVGHDSVTEQQLTYWAGQSSVGGCPVQCKNLEQHPGL